MANTLNLTALPEYIEQNKEQLFVKSTVGARTLDYVELMLGVKHKEALSVTWPLRPGENSWMYSSSTAVSSDRNRMQPREFLRSVRSV